MVEPSTVVEPAHDEDLVLSDLERQRIERTIEMLPGDATTCLEIGFKDQRITNVLSRYDLCSIDLPGSKPASVANKTAYATIAGLPVVDRSFDLAVCTEVLEHLEPDILAAGVAELARVSGRYVLLSVPNRQRVWNELSKCGACGYVCNAMAHLYRFDEDRLKTLFPGFRPVRTAFAGHVSSYAPDVLYWVRNRLGNDWQPCHWGCFRCGATRPAVAPNLLGKATRSAIWRREARRPPRPAFLFMLMERNAA